MLKVTLSIVALGKVIPMANIPKCKICKEEVDKTNSESYVSVSGGVAHKECEDKRIAEKEKVKCHFCKELITDKVVKRGSIKVHQSCLDEYQKSSGSTQVKTRLRTCPKCKEKVDPLSENAIDIENSTLHRECYERSKREKENLTNLLDYISLKYNIEFPTGYMLKQISDYRNKRGYSYKAMLATLKYVFEVEKIPLKEGVGLGLIPFYFEKAKAYYSKLRIAGNSATNITINNTTVKIIAVAENKRASRKSIDLSSI